MAHSVVAAFLLANLTLLGPGMAGAWAQAPAEPPAAEPAPAEAPDLSLSPECRVPGSKLYTIASLRGVKEALKEHRAVKVLAIGASATGGLASPQSNYPVQLEGELEKMFSDGVDFEVVNRGLSGEISGDAAERIRNTVVEVEPDLVVWQVGTNDALARVDVESFSTSLDETVQWLKSHEIDVVLVDPQYTAGLARNDYFGSIVKAIEDVARKDRVPLVRRFEAMRYLSGTRKRRAQGGNLYQMTDLSYRCMAEHVARAIALGLVQAERSPDSSSVDVTTTARITRAPR